MKTSTTQNQVLSALLKAVKFYFESQLMKQVQLIKAHPLAELEKRMEGFDETLTIAYLSFSGEPKGKVVAAIPEALNSILLDELLDLEGEMANRDRRAQLRATSAQFVEALGSMFSQQLKREKIVITPRKALSVNDKKDLPNLFKEAQKQWHLEFEADSLPLFICLMI